MRWNRRTIPTLTKTVAESVAERLHLRIQPMAGLGRVAFSATST